MPVIQDYRSFQGRHYETGTIRNVLAHQGAKMPHTGDPISEALLLGISGGIAVGYFTFEYAGLDALVSLVTRYSFDPMDVIFERLAIPLDWYETTSTNRISAKLTEAISAGKPVIFWGEIANFGYAGLSRAERFWGKLPVVVYGYDTDSHLVYLADRSRVPLTISTEELLGTSEGTGKNRFKAVILGNPSQEKIASAVEAGIRACVSLFLEQPLKGPKVNFGLDGLMKWADLLVDTKDSKG
ncbi:MAG: hypothetical protein EXR62_05865 [Chloroflexi bacterium]|nr:hypothetical protein [Chloroflexota bacterium]